MTSTRILAENARTDGVTDKSYWDAASSAEIEGFATDMSVNAGTRIDFKINLDGGAGKDYKVEIFRLGYYGGAGAREVTEWTNTNGVDQALPLYNAALGLVDAGNWLVTDSWNVPADAVSGVYIARLQMLDSNGNPIPGQTNQIPFIVRNDGVAADIVLQTSDTTWQAYNGWTGGLGSSGGATNLYGDTAGLANQAPIPGASSNAADRAYAVSYNRPFATRDGVGAYAGAHDFLYGADYSAIYFLEQQGYDVSYISGIDTDRLGPDYLQNYKAFISVGHDEYWSRDQRQNVEEARDAGVNVLFWSGNEVYWKIRWETSISADGTEYRTLVCYKETLAVADPNAGPEDYYDLDPTNVWTGTWRDMRFVDAKDANGNYIAGGSAAGTITGMLSECACVETMLTGQLFGPDGTGQFGGALEVPAAFANLRVWRDTNVPTTGIAPGIIGYEWDISPTDATRPAGLIKLSETTLNWNGILIDQGMTTAPGTATHNLSLYRDPESGALVFGAGTVFWTWGLSDMHDNTPYAANIQNTDIKQFTINMFADMGIQPAVTNAFLALQGLSRAIASTDFTAATTTMANLPDTVAAYQTIQIAGTAADANGTTSTADDGKVAAVEVSLDGGVTWRVAQGTTNWSFAWTPTAAGSYTVKARAIDDSLNITNIPTSQDIVTVTAPVTPTGISLFGSAAPTGAIMYNDNTQVELGMKFSVDQAGSITGLRYYRAAADANDTDVREGHLWSSTGALLGTVTFTSVAGQSGWQTATFSSPIALVVGQEYTVSYRTANNYISVNGFFDPSREVVFDGADDDAFTDPTGVISAPQSASGITINGNGLYEYGGALARPTNTWNGSNYFIDVLFTATTSGPNTAPTITSGNYTIPENGAAVGNVTATDAQGNPITYAISGGVDAARFTINATTGALSFVSTPNFEAPTDTGANNVYDLIVSASDGIAPATTKAVTVTVTDVNEVANTAPTITSGNYTIAENTTAVGSVTATDAQSNPITYAISGGVDAARFTINASTGALSFVTAPNYEAPADTGANNVYDLIVSASDGIALATTKAVAVTVTDVAESATSNLFAPGTTPGGFESGTSDPTNYELGTRFSPTQNGQITALQYYRGAADADDTDVRTLSLWNSAGVKIGTVTVTSAAGATGWQIGALTSPISVVAGETYTVSYSYVFNNGQGAVESYANSGSYYTVARPSADGLLVAPVNAGVYAEGTGVLPTSFWNASSYFVDVTFAPTAVSNTAPTITSGNYTIAENGTAVGNVTATDAQSNPITYAISGGVDAARFTINASTGALSFVTAPNYEAPTDAGANNVYDLIVSASDGIAPATTKAVTVTVTDVVEVVNTAPTITSGDYSIPENGTAVGNVTATDAQSNPITYAIAGGADAARFTINATTGALAFVSAPNFEAPTDTGANNVYDIIVSASDGIAPATTKAVAVTVTDVVENTAPTITSGNYTIPENGAAVGNVTATDAQGNPITYAISGGVDAARFTINATTGALSFVSTPNFEAPTDTGANNVYDLIVSASDGIAPATTKAVTVTVTDVAENTAPTISTTNISVAENAVVAGNVVATDAQSNPITYAITGGADGAKFTINATTGQLSFVTRPNFEAPHDAGANNVFDLIVSASDGIAAATTKAITVTVTNVSNTTELLNSAPAITSANYTVAENSTTAGTVTATDSNGNVITYGISGGLDAARFTINWLTGVLTFVTPPDFEAPADNGANNVYNLTVSATDNMATTTKAITVTVTNVNDTANTAPTITSGNYSVPENGAAVGNVVATDAQGNTITYAIAGGVDAARFTINATTGALSFVSAPNFEAPVDVGANNIYDIIVSASDGIAAPTTKAITVTVTDVAENTAPVITSGNYTVPENGTAVGSVTATDAQGNAITYAISGGADAARFTINTSTGLLSFVTAPNYEAPVDSGANNIYDIIVSASDGIAAATTKAVTVNVTDVAENTAPTITSANYTIAENTTAVGGVTATDAQGNAITYAIAGGVDAARFTINATTGALAFVSAPDFEAPADSGANNIYDLIVSASDGIAAPTTKAVTVTVTNVTETANTAPTISSGNYTIPENGTAVGNVTATDAQGNPITYAISGGVDAARFTINASTGALSFVTAPNYEAPTDAGANNVYDLIVSASDGIAAATTKAVTVTVTNVAEAATSLFAAGTTPAAFESGTTDAVNYELGTRFSPTQNGQITALQYYRGAADADDTDVRVLSLWNSSGVKIGSVTVTSGAGATGWQVGTLTSPISLVAGQTYTVSYSYVFNNGQGAVESYANTGAYHTVSRPSADGLLVAPVNAGVYAEGTGVLPTSFWNASSYFVDVLFQPSGGAAPIVLDLAGSGLNLTSNVSFDFDGDGDLEKGSWIGSGNAFLALDRDGDGIVNGISEISFVDDLPGAVTDLQGLSAFDSNDDGILSADDDRFGDFLVWEDTNQDGLSQTTELKSLADAGIDSIDLGGRGPEYIDAQGNVIHGTTDVTLANGATVTAFDVALNYAETRRTMIESDAVPVSEDPALASGRQAFAGLHNDDTIDFGNNSGPLRFKLPVDTSSQGFERWSGNGFHDPELAMLNDLPQHDTPHSPFDILVHDQGII